MNVENINEIIFKDLKSDCEFVEVFIRKDENYFYTYDLCTDDNFCKKCSKWFDKSIYNNCPCNEDTEHDIVTEDHMIDIFDSYIEMDNIAIYVNKEKVR